MTKVSGASPDGDRATHEPSPSVSAVPVSVPSADERDDYPDEEGFYDDCGRWWPNDAEWRDRCQGLGTAECHCGGDQCYCENYGEMECPLCHGEGYFVPTAAFKAAREAHAKWWRELNEKLAASAMSAGTAETRSGSGPQGRQRDGEAGTPEGSPS